MFQFDAGDYDETLAREGMRILSVEGSVAAAVEFMVARLVTSAHVELDTAEQALAFLNAVRVDGEGYPAWLTTVTHYYNGCSPERCSRFESRYDNYGQHTADALDEMGAAFWYPAGDAPDDDPDAGVDTASEDAGLPGQPQPGQGGDDATEDDAGAGAGGPPVNTVSCAVEGIGRPGSPGTLAGLIWLLAGVAFSRRRRTPPGHST